MHWVRRAVTSAAFAAAVALVMGCAGEGDYGEVYGTVSYDGKLIEEGQIKFVPADGKGPSAGGVIKDGKYTATKVPVGNTKVSISGSKVVGKKKVYDTPNSPEMPLTAELLPTKYNDKSDLTFEVKRGNNEKNWELPK
jgi:hypothetical protein